MFALRKRESSNGPFIGGELPISTQIPNKNSWIAETTRCQGARVPTLARLRAASAPPASPRLLTAAGAPRLASSCLRPPSREARSTFRRKRVRTLGGSVGLCCHGTSTFEGQGGVAGNTTWTVGVRKPRACCQTQRQIPPCERASRRPVASDQWPATSGRRAGRRFPACPARSTSHTFTAVCPRRSPRPLPIRTEDCSCLGTVTLDCLSCRLPLKALALTPCWGNV